MCFLLADREHAAPKVPRDQGVQHDGPAQPRGHSTCTGGRCACSESPHRGFQKNGVRAIISNRTVPSHCAHLVGQRNLRARESRLETVTRLTAPAAAAQELQRPRDWLPHCRRPGPAGRQMQRRGRRPAAFCPPDARHHDSISFRRVGTGSKRGKRVRSVRFCDCVQHSPAVGRQEANASCALLASRQWRVPPGLPGRTRVRGPAQSRLPCPIL